MGKQKSELRAQITESPTLKELLGELLDEYGRTQSLWEELKQERSGDRKDQLESELYVALVRCEAKLASVLKEWDRVVDEELPDE